SRKNIIFACLQVFWLSGGPTTRFQGLTSLKRLKNAYNCRSWGRCARYFFNYRMVSIITPYHPIAKEPRYLRLLFSSAAFLFLIMSIPVNLMAEEEVKTYQTLYATISSTGDADRFRFTLNVGSGLRFLSESPEKNPLLAKTRVDKIVETVSALLDMHPLKLHFTISLCKTHAEVATAYKALGMQGAVPVAFYSHGSRTIAVSIDDITDRILAHEIAHAVICAYFVVPPPVRMQEILAQYVDKHLWD
ncbi:MAG: hypothetical protein ACYDAA_14335, partial [Syntrophales bacterium]